MPAAASENEQLVIDFFTTLSTGDLEAVRKRLHPDASWTPMVKDIPGAGRHQGRDVIVDDFLAPVRGMFEPGDPKVEIDNIFSKGPLVACETRGVGRLKNGKEYRNVYCWIFEIKDGLVFAIREYMDSHHVASLVE